jgi:CRP-like cAMP-binding protein
MQGLGPSQLATLADCAMKTEFAPGQLLFNEGDIANRFYLILKGKVALEARSRGDSPLLIETIGAGEVLGWSWLFEPYTWHFDARAVEKTTAIFFYDTWVREQCEQDRDFGCELYKRVALVVIDRLQNARRRLLELSFPAGTASGNLVPNRLHD